MIINTFIKEFEKARKRNWKYIYAFIDLHETCVKPNYQVGNITTEFYPFAKEALQAMSKREDLILVMWTCSHPEEIKQYLEYFAAQDIVFKFVNENPEVVTDKLSHGNYDKKPYCNILIDDKAGFEVSEWFDILEFVNIEKQL